LYVYAPHAKLFADYLIGFRGIRILTNGCYALGVVKWASVTRFDPSKVGHVGSPRLYGLRLVTRPAIRWINNLTCHISTVFFFVFFHFGSIYFIVVIDITF